MNSFQIDILNHQSSHSDSNPSPLAINQNSSTANSTTNNGTQQQNENGSNGTPNQTQSSSSQSAGQPNSQGNYYYRDTQPLKLETYPDIGPLQCYQTMEDEESETEVE